MPDQKITQLTEDTTPTHDDLIVTVNDPAGTPVNRKSKLSSLFFKMQEWIFGQDAGSTDTYVVTLSPAPTAYATGYHYRFKANTANTGACSINFNSLGAVAIKKAAGGITTDLTDNDIRAGQWVDLVYDGTNMQMQSTLGNASGGGTTINPSDNRVPVRTNATTFGDSLLEHNAANTRTNSFGHLQFDTNRAVGYGDAAWAWSGIGALKAVAGPLALTTPATFLSNFASPPEPGGNPAPWSSVGMNFRRVLTSNITIGAPANHGGDGTAPSGYRFILMLVQDATGSRTATWHADFKFPGGTTPTLTTAANAVDIFEFVCFNDIAYCIGQFLDVK